VQVDLDDIVATASAAVSHALQLPHNASPARPTLQKPFYMALTLPDAECDRIAEAFCAAQARAQLPLPLRAAKRTLHVTLWHPNTGTEEALSALLKAEGSEVDFEVTGFYLAEEVAAAWVHWVGVPGWVQEGSLHVTLCHSARVNPALAGTLAEREQKREEGVAFLPIEQGLVVKGTVERRPCGRSHPSTSK
jgi:hypothetical protein